MNAQQQHEQPSASPSTLDARDLEILAFERQWWKYAGAKEQAIKELFDMSSTRYYQVLNALIDNRPPSLPTRCSSSGCGAAVLAPAGAQRAPARLRRLSRRP